MLIREEALERFAIDVLQSVGVPPHNAAIMASNMVQADLRGVETHGTAKLADHVGYLRSGELDPRAEPEVHRDRASTAVIDGHGAASGLAAHRAMTLAVEKAKKTSIAAVAVRNVGRCGALSTFTSLAVENDMIGIMTAQGNTVVPPFGGRTRMLNTSPWSFGAPAGEEYPVILDMSSTTTAHSRITLAAKEGRKIPFGELLDASGRPTDDPNDLNTGSMTWIGGAKGYGLAVIDQVLAGILGAAPLIGVPVTDEDVHRRGHFALAINIDAFMDVADFKREMDAFIRRLKSSERLDGVDEILLPGERAARAMVERRRNGIEVRDVTWKALMELSRTCGVPLEPEPA